MKGFVWMIVACLGFSLLACSETEEYNEFADRWPERNAAYIDSIAAVARASQGDEVGEWLVVRSYRLKDDDNALGTVNNQDYVYAKRLRKSESTESPLYTDSVFVAFKGWLIPTVSYPEGAVFQPATYYGELTDEETLRTLVPSKGIVSQYVVGFTSILQYMHPGEILRVYIPQNLAYGSEDNETGSVTIPAYSTLVFDLYLQRFKKLEDW